MSCETQTEVGGKNILLKMSNHLAGEAVTFTASSDLVTLNNHGLANGDLVQFDTIVTTTGIVVDTDYYVISATTNTFQVALTSGGSAINLISDGTGTLGDSYQILGGLRSKSFSFNSEAIDITTHDSSEWKKILDSAGIRSVSLSGSGVYENGTVMNRARSRAFANQNTSFQLIINADGDYFQGCFKITSLELSGDYNAESNYSLSMESASAVTFTLGA
jgi:TP901-1 family phage major tail protein